MSQFVVQVPETPSVPVEGSEACFPVRRIYCVGRNYADHAVEMGGTGRESPFFFMKLADAVVPVGAGRGEMKQQRRPWCISKGFDQSAPLAPITPAGVGAAIKPGDVSTVWDEGLVPFTLRIGTLPGGA